MTDLPVTVDGDYADDPANPSRKLHQQHHDSVHALYNELKGTQSAAGLATLRALLDGTYGGLPPAPHVNPPNTRIGSTAFPSAPLTYYWRVDGWGTISKIAMHVAVASGNISAAVCTGPAGLNGPTGRAATSGAIACPAAGYAEVSLGTSVLATTQDWFALSADNTTATINRIDNNTSDAGSFLGAGFCAKESAHPVPAAPSSTPTLGPPAFILIGVV